MEGVAVPRHALNHQATGSEHGERRNDANEGCNAYKGAILARPEETRDHDEVSGL
jgi:hypothetical protein